MKRIPTFLKMVVLLVVVLGGRPVVAQTQVSGRRFLFIVETAKTMKEQFPAVVKSVGELLGSGLKGQLQPGDTIGLWTYDSEMRAGIFPMQLWQETNRTDIARAAGRFLNQQQLKDTANLAKVLPDTIRLLEKSEAITVLLYSDGLEPVQGTPFDDSINEAFKLYGNELRDEHVPFVTVLVGRGGKIVKCAMNSSLVVNIPKLPAPVETATSVPAVKTTLPPANPIPPLILDYSKSNLASAATSPATNPIVLAELEKAETAEVMPISPPPAAEAAPQLNTSPAPATVVGETVTSQPPVAIQPVKPTEPVAPVSLVNETGQITAATDTPPPAHLPKPVALPTRAAPETEQKNPSFLLVTSVGAALVMGFLAGMMIRRRRTAAHASIITQSFEKREK